MNIIKFKKDLDTFSNSEIKSIAKMYNLVDNNVNDLRWYIAIRHASRQQMPNTVDVIKRYFPNAEITVDDSDYKIKVRCAEQPNTEIIFTIDEEKLYLQLLYRCNDKSGTENLNNIIAIAREIGLPKMSLLDASTLFYGGDPNVANCDISLATVYILLYGQSWYNKFGFKSASYASEIEHNEKIRKMSLADFLEKLLPMIKENLLSIELHVFKPVTAKSERLRARQEAQRQEQREKIIAEFGSKENYVQHVEQEVDKKLNAVSQRVMSIVNDPHKITVAEFAKYLYDNYIQNKLDACDRECVQFVRNFFDWSEKLLKYDGKLSLYF